MIVPEKNATIELLGWLAGQGMDVEAPLPRGFGDIEKLARGFDKPKFADAISKAKEIAATAAKSKQDAADVEFAKKGAALGKYRGPDADNRSLLVNPNAFEPGTGYYFGNVMPDKWMTRDRVLCHAVDTALVGNKGESELFLILIEDAELRRAFTPSTISAPYSSASLSLGFDVILVPYDDPTYTSLPTFKLVAMKPAKLTLQ